MARIEGVRTASCPRGHAVSPRPTTSSWACSCCAAGACWLGSLVSDRPYVVVFSTAAVSVPDDTIDVSAGSAPSLLPRRAADAARRDDRRDDVRAAVSHHGRRPASTPAASRPRPRRPGRDHVRVDSVYANALGGFAANLNAAQLAAISRQSGGGGSHPGCGRTASTTARSRARAMARRHPCELVRPAWQVPAGVRRVGARTSSRRRLHRSRQSG